MTEAVKGILLRTEHLNGMKRLRPEQLGALVLALFADAGEGDMPELDEVTRVVFELVVPSVRRANDAYARRCEANAENGRRGGRPRKLPENRQEARKATAFSEESRNPDEREKELIPSPPSPPGEQVRKSGRGRFVPPEPEDVRAYCLERGNGLSAERFCDYYAAQGWRLSNGRPLKDWKAAVRNWENRRQAPGHVPVGQGGFSEAERRQARNDEVCRRVAAELETMGGPF